MIYHFFKILYAWCALISFGNIIRIGLAHDMTHTFAEWNPDSQKIFLSGDDYQIIVPECVPDTIICELVPKNSKWLTHMRGAFQSIAPCWSIFKRFPHLRPVILQSKTKNDFPNGIDTMEHLLIEHPGRWRWVREMISYIGCDVVTNLGSDVCAVRAIQEKWRSGWSGDYVKWFMDQDDVIALQKRMNFSEIKLNKNLRIGILDRNFPRNLVNSDSIVNMIKDSYPDFIIDYVNFNERRHPNLRMSAQWIRTQDIIISPYGEQNTNFVFARPCTTILEIFPKYYYHPGFYLSLAKAAGAITFSAIPNCEGCQDATPPLPTDLLRHRSANVELNISSSEIMYILPKLLNSYYNCIFPKLIAAYNHCS